MSFLLYLPGFVCNDSFFVEFFFQEKSLPNDGWKNVSSMIQVEEATQGYYFPTVDGSPMACIELPRTDLAPKNGGFQ